MKKTVSMALCFCLTGFLCPLLVSCQSFGSNSNEIPETEKQPLPAQRFAMIIKEKNNRYLLKMYEGFLSACEEIGAEAILYGPDSYSASEQISMINQLIVDGVDVIAISANDPDALEPALQSAMDAGIVVVSLDSSVNTQSRALHIQQVDPEKVGRVLIQAAFEMVGGKGTAAIITSTPYAANQNLWLDWMKWEYQENSEKYREFILLEERYGEDSAEATKRETLALIEEHPELSIIITPSAVSMTAVGESLGDLESDILFTGLGLPSEVAPYILDGSCPWMYLWNPIDLGYLAAYASNAILEQSITPKLWDSFEAGRLGVRSVTTCVDGGLEVLLGDPVKFDGENIHQWKSVY